MGLLPAFTIAITNQPIGSVDHNNDMASLKAWADTYVLLTDTARTVTAALTFSTSPVFPAAVTMALGLTITASGLTITAGGLTVTAGASTFGAGVTVTGTVTATTFAGSGASLTAIPQSAVTSLTTDLAGKASSTHTHAASDITSGTIANARLSGGYDGITQLSTVAMTGNITFTNALLFDDNAPELALFGASSSAIAAATGTPFSSTGLGSPAGKTTLTGAKFVKIAVGGTDHYVMLFTFS